MENRKIDLGSQALFGFDGPSHEARPAMVGRKNPPPDSDDDDGGTLQPAVERLLSDPRRADALTLVLAGRVQETVGNVDLVAATAIGGLIVGFELARHLGVPLITVEKSDGAFKVREGPEVTPGARCLVVDDTFLSGRSMVGCIAAVESAGAKVVGGSCLLYREYDEAEKLDVPLVSLGPDAEALEAALPAESA
jgi:orotate phosphoribosyltransferase